MGAFEEEWAQIKRERSGGPGMELASANGGGHSDGLKSNNSAWSRAAHGVGAMRGDIKKALTGLEDGQKGLGAGSDTGADSVECAAAQRELYRSWHRYLSGVSGRCGALQGKLEKAGSDHTKNDDSVTSSFAGLDDRYKDTEAVGGEHGRNTGKS